MNNKLYRPEVSDSKLLRRSEKRFNYSMEISFRTKSERFAAKTINVSSKGMKFSTAQKPQINIVDFIYIIIPELNAYLDSFIVEEQIRKKPREPLTYEVVYIEANKNETIIACQYIGHFNNDMLKLESYIEDKLQSCQVDNSHRVHNIINNYYEYLYFNDSHQLFYYFLPNGEECLFVESEKNQVLYDFFTPKNVKNSKPDLSPFISLNSLRKMIKQNISDIDFYLFIFWEHDKLYYWYSFELNDKQDINTVLQQTINNNGLILKGYSNSISLSKASDKKRLASLSLNAEQMIHQIVFCDISDCVRHYFINIFELSSPSSSVFTPIKREAQKNCQSSYLSFKSHSQRIEKRYLFKTELKVRFSNDKDVLAETLDFSRTGISIVLDKKYASAITLGATLLIDFSYLSRQVRGLKLTSIPFTIKNISTNPFTKQTILGLVRNTAKCEKNINQFFEIIEKKNRSTLPLCKLDRLRYADKQFTQKHLKETLSNILIFLNSTANDLTIKEVEIYNKSCKLAQFFQINDKFDFSCLTRLFLVESYAHYIKQQDNSSRPILAFFIRINDQIKIITSLEIKQKNKLKQIAHDTIKKNGLCVLIKLHKNNMFDEQAFEISYQMHSSSKADEITTSKKQLKDICGYMELMDISSFFKPYL